MNPTPKNAAIQISTVADHVSCLSRLSRKDNLTIINSETECSKTESAIYPQAGDRNHKQNEDGRNNRNLIAEVVVQLLRGDMSPDRLVFRRFRHADSYFVNVIGPEDFEMGPGPLSSSFQDILVSGRGPGTPLNSFHKRPFPAGPAIREPLASAPVVDPCTSGLRSWERNSFFLSGLPRRDGSS